ncbi:MAG: LysM peptidoglycan-binding domain-containing protein [Nitrospinae bacterium]|nr:LysM peptidoglycan-binding domain-containing protein [Nitrospinota bacterium]
MATALRYTILSGDTFSSISDVLNASAGISYQDIEQANPDVPATALSIGMLLNIPSKESSTTVMKYTVLSGDSYSKIASGLSKCSGITYQEIEEANPDISPNSLSIGQIINIPEAGTPSATVTTTSQQVNTDAKVAGFWWWTWSKGSAPSSTNLSLAFSGWTDPQTALQNSASVKGKLAGSKYICLGGGNENGAFTTSALTSVTNAINNGDFSGYDGIAYDVEEGDTGLESLFQASFAAAQAKGFKVLVTVSHSQPYGIKDASTLMSSFFSDTNINYLSPQLYTSGEETSNDYTAIGVQWSEYAQAKAAVVPSIVNATMYEDAKTYFSSKGVNILGFVQWSQS